VQSGTVARGLETDREQAIARRSVMTSKHSIVVAIRGLLSAGILCGAWVGCIGAPPDEGAEETENVTEESQALTCGGAGQPCCLGGSCNFGLECNENGVCRTPCGGEGERCCSYGCDPGLICKSNNTCGTSSSSSSGGGGCTVMCGIDPISGANCGSCGIGFVCSGGACIQTVGCTSSYECPGSSYCNVSSGLCCNTPLDCFQP
jgi:hypothetical protein